MNSNVRCYEDLANAIVVQAVTDYQQSRTRLKERKFNTTDYKEYNCEKYVKEVPKFFRSVYFTTLTKLDGEYILQNLEDMIED